LEGEMLKRRLILLVTVIVAVVIVVFILLTLYSGTSDKPPILTISNGTLKISLLEVQRGDLCFKYSYWKRDTRVYEIIHVEEDRVSYLIKLRITNTGSEMCTLRFYLLTSKDVRGSTNTGVRKTIFSGKNATSEQKALIEKCLGEPEDLIRDMISLYYSSKAIIQSGSANDVWLIYGLEPDEKVIKLKVLAVCLSGLSTKQLKPYLYSLEIPLPEQ